MQEKKKAHHIWKEDVVQLVFGSLMLGVPAAFTEEIWILGESLTPINYFLLFLSSMVLIALMVFHTGYKIHSTKTLEILYIKRVLLSYFIIFLTCTVFLSLIGRAPWFSDTLVAIQRTIVMGVPASISGIAVDIIK